MPQPNDGWFDLLENEWVAEFHPEVEYPAQGVSSAISILERIEQKVRAMKNSSNVPGFAVLDAELSMARKLINSLNQIRLQ
jgi:hypothetical protein